MNFVRQTRHNRVAVWRPRHNERKSFAGELIHMGKDKTQQLLLVRLHPRICPVLIHMGTDKTQQLLLVRVQQPNQAQK